MNPRFLAKVVYPAYYAFKSMSVLRLADEYRENQCKSVDELAYLQSAKLEKLLDHASKTVPYYKERYKLVGRKLNGKMLARKFAELPLVNKSEIRHNLQKMVSTKLEGNRLIKNSTSGSTGEATYLFYDVNSWNHRRAIVIRNQEWLGVGLGDKRATLWGAPMDVETASALRGRVHNWVTNHLFLSSYAMSDGDLERCTNALAAFQPKLLTSYPGPLTTLAQYVLGTNRRIPSIGALISSAETLFSWQRYIIEEALGCRVFNRYGCREVGDIAQQCKKQLGLHVNSDRYVVEILNQSLEPAAVGESGEVVITDLDNYGMPLIRYRVGDVASYTNDRCPCGMSLPSLANVEGRVLDIVKAPNGSRIGGTFWTLLFKSRAGIQAFQVVQDQLDEITVKYVRDGSAKPNLEYFKSRIQEMCGVDFGVEFVECKEISKTASGKSRFVVSTV